MMEQSLVIIAHNIRSAYNVGALLRTADGLGVNHLYFTGYTPYPKLKHDTRLPHIAERLHKQISKTSLGAEKTVKWNQFDEPLDIIGELQLKGYQVAGLEQDPKSIPLNEFLPPAKLVILLGSEVSGIDKSLLEKVDFIIEISMEGSKESFNVIEAATMAMYHCKYMKP